MSPASTPASRGVIAVPVSPGEEPVPAAVEPLPPVPAEGLPPVQSNDIAPDAADLDRTASPPPQPSPLSDQIYGAEAQTQEESSEAVAPSPAAPDGTPGDERTPDLEAFPPVISPPGGSPHAVPPLPQDDALDRARTQSSLSTHPDVADPPPQPDDQAAVRIETGRSVAAPVGQAPEALPRTPRQDLDAAAARLPTPEATPPSAEAAPVPPAPSRPRPDVDAALSAEAAPSFSEAARPSMPSREAATTAPAAPAGTGGAAEPDAPPPSEVAASAEPTPPIRPRLLTLQGGSFLGTDAVPVNRPGVGTEAPPPAPEPEPLPDDAPALLRFAADWSPPAETLPHLALVLIDDGQTPAAPALAADLPIPVSVALEASLPDATGRMAAYRAAGIEVLALARLPVRAEPVDVEVFLGGALAVLPEAVAVLDLGEGGLREQGVVAQMALSRLAREGRGAVLASGGLGRGAEGAEAAGVPAVEILRDLDGAGQDGHSIRRQLDDAARRAGQEGQAVVLARMRPATLEAIAEWSQDRRAQDVTVAPVSAVLAPPSDS